MRQEVDGHLSNLVCWLELIDLSITLQDILYNSAMGNLTATDCIPDLYWSGLQDPLSLV